MEEAGWLRKPTSLRDYLGWIGLNAVGLGVGSLGYFMASGSDSLFQMVRGVNPEFGVQDEYDALGLAILVFSFHFAQWLFFRSRANLRASAIFIAASVFYLLFLGTLHFAGQIAVVFIIFSLILFGIFSELMLIGIGASISAILTVGGTGSVVIFVPATIATLVLISLSRKTTSFPEKWQLINGVAGIILGAVVGLASAAMREQGLFPQVVVMIVAGAIYGLITAQQAKRATTRILGKDDYST